MNPAIHPMARSGALLAINLLFLMAWGFAGIRKLLDGVPPWFQGKFGQTFLAQFPGLTASFWLLTAAELAAFALALVALVRLEFFRQRRPVWLEATIVWSLFVFVQHGFGQWLTADYNATFQLFAYFGVALVALQFVGSDSRAA